MIMRFYTHAIKSDYELVLFVLSSPDVHFPQPLNRFELNLNEWFCITLGPCLFRFIPKYRPAWLLIPPFFLLRANGFGLPFAFSFFTDFVKIIMLFLVSTVSITDTTSKKKCLLQSFIGNNSKTSFAVLYKKKSHRPIKSFGPPVRMLIFFNHCTNMSQMFQ